jgi:small-conductance mechanosensitive channel
MDFFNELPSMGDVSKLLSDENLQLIVRVFIFAMVGMLFAGFSARWMRRIVARHSTEHTALVASRLVSIAFVVVITMTVFYSLDIQLAPLLGAAGILSIAISFAAQSSLSNLISGVFLYMEKPFRVGDLIRIDGILGIVMSIDLFSVKMRKLDHIFVRIPNENVVKSTVENITRFPIRRMDVVVRVTYQEDPQRVMDILREVAEQNRTCLDEPEPLVLFKDYGLDSMEFLWGLWFEKTDYLNLRNSILVDLKTRFEQEGIAFALPHRTLGIAGHSPALKVISTEDTSPAPEPEALQTPPAELATPKP